MLGITLCVRFRVILDYTYVPHSAYLVVIDEHHFFFTFGNYEVWPPLFNNAVKDMGWLVRIIHICYCCVEDPPAAMTPTVPAIGRCHLP